MATALLLAAGELARIGVGLVAKAHLPSVLRADASTSARIALLDAEWARP